MEIHPKIEIPNKNTKAPSNLIAKTILTKTVVIIKYPVYQEHPEAIFFSCYWFRFFRLALCFLSLNFLLRWSE
jgi:hypothetical protein